MNNIYCVMHQTKLDRARSRSACFSYERLWYFAFDSVTACYFWTDYINIKSTKSSLSQIWSLIENVCRDRFHICVCCTYHIDICTICIICSHYVLITWLSEVGDSFGGAGKKPWVSTSVCPTPLDIFKHASGQFPALFVVTKWLQICFFTRFFQVKTQCFPNLNQVVFMPNQAHIVVTTLNSKLSQRISKDVVGRSVRSHIYSGNWIDLCCEWEPIQIIGHKNGQPPGSTVTSYRLMFKKKIYTQRISTNVSPTGIL